MHRRETGKYKKNLTNNIALGNYSIEGDDVFFLPTIRFLTDKFFSQTENVRVPTTNFETKEKVNLDFEMILYLKSSFMHLAKFLCNIFIHYSPI